MSTCFVMQPFDNGKLDKRYEETFKIAIENSGLIPYRIDKDPSVRVLIDEIEKRIIDSAICFAEITFDNPNVWYELGFAVACGRDIVMVCSDERPNGKFPFDIQHRHIITYSTGSKGDFEDLQEKIEAKIKALLSTSRRAKELNDAPIAEIKGLKGYEIALLVLIMENQITDEDIVAVYGLKNDMSKAGYNDIATSLGIRSLQRNKMITTFETEWNNNDQPYLACKMTDLGIDWMMENQDKIEFRKGESSKDDIESDDLPF